MAADDRDPAEPGKSLEPEPTRPDPKPTRKKVRTRVTTANINSSIQGQRAREAYAAAAAGTDILCTQEDHTRKAADLMPVGWATYQAGTRRCSVHWRTDLFKKRSARTLLLNLANGLTFPAASRKAATVVLEDLRTGGLIKVTSVHFVPHADDDQIPGKITPMPRGSRAVIPSINALIADAESHPEQVQIIAGDVNIDLDADLARRDEGMVERLRRAGFVTDVEQLGPTPDTHGSNEYDWLLVRGGRWVEHRTRAKGKSDHRAKSATVEY